MESEYRKGYVYIQNHFSGIIAETEEGYIFTYDQDYLDREDAVAVSLTLPLRQEPYETTILFPFFDGLIPDGFWGWSAETGKSTRKTGLAYCYLPAETALAMFISGEKRYEMLVLWKVNNK